jgi:hypothetical protein
MFYEPLLLRRDEIRLKDIGVPRPGPIAEILTGEYRLG